MTDYFLSCDWGSSLFRLRLVSREKLELIEEVHSDQGATRFATAKGLAGETDFSSYLVSMLRILDEKNPTAGVFHLPVVISGMASSAHGWRELPYACVPFGVDGKDIVYETLELALPEATKQSVYLLSGIRTETDVIRGEEVEIMGLFSHPDWSPYRRQCQVILPGTHSKHVEVRDARIHDFCTHMTGELYELLSKYSVLRFAVGGAEHKAGWTEKEKLAFQQGLSAARQGELTRRLFSVRTRALFRTASAAENAGYLSGLLIGAELKDLLGQGKGGPYLLCSTALLEPLYREAFTFNGVEQDLRVVPADQAQTLSVAGHARFLEQIGK